MGPTENFGVTWSENFSQPQSMSDVNGFISKTIEAFKNNVAYFLELMLENWAST